MSHDRVTKGNLPHWYKPGHAHFVTYRLAGSIPQHLLRQWRTERLAQSRVNSTDSEEQTSKRDRAHKIFFKKYDQHLDRSDGIRWLEKPDVAELIRENLYYHHGSLYQLLSWCVLPNHVHLLFQPLESKAVQQVIGADERSDSNGPLARIMHSLKSYTANAANKLLDRSGSFWQAESYDHWVRDADELDRIHTYIQLNPVKAELCERPEQWRFSSSFDRYQTDGSTCGYVGEMRDDWKG